jgi:hypothetical protein
MINTQQPSRKRVGHRYEKGSMADNTAKARKELAGMRGAARDHISKWRKYPAQQDKDFAAKTIERIQGDIRKIKSEHPSLNQSASEDSWTIRNG